MSRSAPRSVEQYLEQLKAALAGEDPALQQDALYDAEEYLRAEVAQHPGKSEADVLELIASTLWRARGSRRCLSNHRSDRPRGARHPAPPSVARRIGQILQRVHGLARVHIAVLHVVVAGDGHRLLHGGGNWARNFRRHNDPDHRLPVLPPVPRPGAGTGDGRGTHGGGLTGTRMPRRPAHASTTAPWYERVVGILKDRHTWTALLYMILKLPLGIAYFTIATVGLAIGLGMIVGPIFWALHLAGVIHVSGDLDINGMEPWAIPFAVAFGVLVLTLVLHLAKGLAACTDTLPGIAGASGKLASSSAQLRNVD